MSGETIGYDIADEVVDSSSSTTEDLEGEIVKAIEEKIGDKDTLAAETLENLSKDQLGEFLAKENFTESGAKSYSEIMNNKYLYFSLRAALQLIGRGDTKFYQIDGSISEVTQADENNKTIDEWLKSWGGIANTKDENMVKFLQKIVGVTVDGRPGPQTIWGVINALGYTGSNEIAEKVNKFYEGNETFQAMKIGEFTKGDKEYKYDQSKITIGQNDENATTINDIPLTFDEGGTITTPGFEIKNGWIVMISGNNNGQKDNQNDNIEKYQPQEIKYSEFNQEYLTGLTSILNNNKKDVVDFIKSMDPKYINSNFKELIPLIKESNINITIVGQDLTVSVNSITGFSLKSIKIKTSAAINANMEYDKVSFTKALEDQLIKEYIQTQYKNIPGQTKVKIYTIADSPNVKVQTFIKDNDFNNLNILNYTALDTNNNVIFQLPETSNGKPIKHLAALKAIKIDVKQVVNGNNVDLIKLKTLLDIEISKIIGVEIGKLSSIREKEKDEVLAVTYKDYEYTFADENTKQEFLNIINTPNQGYISKNGIIYEPPSSNVSKDKMWYKVKGGKLYKCGSGHNRSNARVYNSASKQYDVDNNSASNRTDADRIS